MTLPDPEDDPAPKRLSGLQLLLTGIAIGVVCYLVIQYLWGAL